SAMFSVEAIVTCLSHGKSAASAPSPDGPTSSPTRMKPITGEIRKRAKAGMTMPAAPSTTSALPMAEVSVSDTIRADLMQAGPDWLDGYPNLFGCLCAHLLVEVFDDRLEEAFG